MKRLIRENWVLAFVMLLTVLYIITGFIFKNRFDVFTFPFQSDVHGALSDWVMVCVTAVTAHYLWKTLQSQMDVQRMQESLHEIEEHKFYESIKPNFSVTSNLKQKRSRDGQSLAVLNVTVLCNDHAATQVEISASYRIHTMELITIPPLSYPNIDPRDSYEIVSNFESEVPNGRHFNAYVDVLITYYDMKEANRYQQIFTFTNRRPHSYNLLSDNKSLPRHIWTSSKGKKK